MPRVSSSLLVFSLLGLGLTTLFAAKKKAEPPADAPPQLISTKGNEPKWKNLKELTAFAAKGDPQACFELGSRLLEGDAELPGDPARARTLLEQAGQGGVPDALFRLGKIYHDGLGVPRDYAKALEYYLAAARRGVPEAQFNIGAMLVSARGVKRDYVEGLAWLILAGHSGAVSDAEGQVRARLAKKPADIRAAEARATELSANLSSVSLQGINAPPPAIREPPKLSLPTVAPSPPEKISIAAPKLDPAAHPKITVPLEPIPSPPR